MQTRKEIVMIRSPRGPKNVTAQSDFPLDISDNYISQEINTSITHSTQLHNTDTDNQLVCTP